MSQWKITFKDLEDATFEVRIWDGNGRWDETAETTALEGAAVPFETQEDNDSDIFTPIRTQSGYIRIIANDAAILSQLMPTDATDKKVVLSKRNGGNMWYGYIQAQDFSQDWTAPPYELEIPIINRLGALNSISVPQTDGEGHPQIRGLKQIQWYISKAFEEVHSSIDSIVYINNNLNSGTDADIVKLLALENFFEDIDKSETIQTGETVIPKKWGEVLESICKFYGWQLREHKADFYFMNYDQGRPTRQLRMYRLINGGLDDWGATSIPDDVTNIADYIDGTAHTEDYVTGYRKVVVESDTNDKMDNLFESNWEDRDGAQFIAEDSKSVQIEQDEAHQYFWRIYDISHFTDIQIKQYDNNNNEMQRTLQDQGLSLVGENFNTSNHYSGAEIVQDYLIKAEDAPSYLDDKDFTDKLNIVGSTGNDARFAHIHVATITTKYVYRGMNSKLRISMNAYDFAKNTLSQNETQSLIYISLRYGDHYYSPDDEDWNSQEEIMFGCLLHGNKLCHQAESFWHEGFYLPKGDDSEYPVNAGSIQIRLYAQRNTNTAISSLKVSIEPRVTTFEKLKKESSTTIIKLTGKPFQDEYSLDLDIASQNQKQQGMAILREAVNGDRPCITKIFDGEGDVEHPTQGSASIEQWLCQRLKNWCENRHRVLEIEIENNDYTPAQFFTIGSTTFANIATATNWRDNHTKITLIEL